MLQHELTAPPNRWNEVELVNRVSGNTVFMDERATQSLSSFSAGDTLTLCVWDADRNTNRHEVESLEAELRNDTTGQLIPIVLHESNFAALADADSTNDFGKNSSLFAAKVSTAYGENGESRAHSDNQEAGNLPTLSVRGRGDSLLEIHRSIL